MNTKETLKKLHEVFPDFDADTLLKILDCYVEEPRYNLDNPWRTVENPWKLETSAPYCVKY